MFNKHTKQNNNYNLNNKKISQQKYSKKILKNTKN